MPDPLKLAALEKAGYEIRETCGSCLYFVSGTASPWGSCSKHPSAHAKHTDGARLSVRRDGWCPSYEVETASGCDIARSGFARFIKVPPTAPEMCGTCRRLPAVVHYCSPCAP